MARNTELDKSSDAFIKYLMSENDFNIMDHRILDLARAFCNSVQSALFPVKKTDIPFAIFALRTVLSSLVDDDPDAALAAEEMAKFFDVTRIHAVIPARMEGDQ